MPERLRETLVLSDIAPDAALALAHCQEEELVIYMLCVCSEPLLFQLLKLSNFAQLHRASQDDTILIHE